LAAPYVEQDEWRLEWLTMSITINTQPVEVVLDGTSFNLQGDPTNSKEWAALLETEVSYGAKQTESHQALTDALVALAETPEDATIIKGLDVGTRTLKLAAEAYVREVTGFPTAPPKRSTKG
jgi:hypothetical protein